MSVRGDAGHKRVTPRSVRRGWSELTSGSSQGHQTRAVGLRRCEPRGGSDEAARSQTPTARFVSAFIVVTLITAGATHARALFVSAVVALVIGGGAYDASAQSMFDPRSEFGPFVHQATLTTSGLTSIAGDTALVAAGGVVVAWERDPETDAWAEGARLAPSDSAANFGRALAFDGATAIVGAEDAAYLFVRETGAWRELAKLIPRDGLSGFGAAVDIDGSHAIVGRQRRVHLHV